MLIQLGSPETPPQSIRAPQVRSYLQKTSSPLRDPHLFPIHAFPQTNRIDFGHLPGVHSAQPARGCGNEDDQGRGASIARTSATTSGSSLKL